MEDEDIYRDFSACYDLYVGDKLDDLPLYLDYAAATKGSLLEVGAGSGRLTIPLARAGYELVAVDVSPSMLALLRAKLAREPEEVRRRVAIIEADVCRLTLSRSFGLVFLPFYTFNYLLTPDAQEARPPRRGRPAPYRRLSAPKLLTECPSAPVLRREAVDPATGRPVRCLVAYGFDRGRQLEFRRHIFEMAGEETATLSDTSSRRRGDTSSPRSSRHSLPPTAWRWRRSSAVTPGNRCGTTRSSSSMCSDGKKGRQEGNGAGEKPRGQARPTTPPPCAVDRGTFRYLRVW
ncbi:MAG: class I SAM-dependent methyltransferase [Firmicutes bacterium]|nr:class I SAM-dependent methyltransferase [Bacillota bacterium]